MENFFDIIERYVGWLGLQSNIIELRRCDCYFKNLVGIGIQSKGLEEA